MRNGILNHECDEKKPFLDFISFAFALRDVTLWKADYFLHLLMTGMLTLIDGTHLAFNNGRAGESWGKFTRSGLKIVNICEPLPKPFVFAFGCP